MVIRFGSQCIFYYRLPTLAGLLQERLCPQGPPWV